MSVGASYLHFTLLYIWGAVTINTSLLSERVDLEGELVGSIVSKVGGGSAGSLVTDGICHL